MKNPSATIPVVLIRHTQYDPRYADVEATRLPAVENLEQTRARVSEFWLQQVETRLRHRQRVLISAHGNSLRALLMQLSAMTIEQVASFEIPKATPIIYHFSDHAIPLYWQYLGSDCESNQVV